LLFILNIFKRIIPTSDFNRHVTTLIVGQLFVHLISFAALPIITRIYSVEQIGSYSLFMAIFMVLSIVSTGRYDSAIVVEPDEKKSIALWSLSLLISFLFSLILFVLLLIFKENLLLFLKTQQLGIYILLLPLAIFLASINRATQFYFNKIEAYRKITQADIIKSGVNSSGGVVLGLLKFLSGGLIVANILSLLISAFYLFFQLPKRFWNAISFSVVALKEVAISYKDYLSYYSISGVLSALVSNGTPIFIIFFFTEKTAGYYFMAEKVVSIPLGLVVAAISRVFYQKATLLYHENKNEFLQLIFTIQKRMLFVLIPLLIVLSLAAPYFFELFGDDWRKAGEMIKYFAVLVFFNNLVSPVGSISNIINRLDILLYFNIVLAVCRLGTFYIGSLFFSFEYALLLSAFVLSLCYIGLDFYLKKLIRDCL